MISIGRNVPDAEEQDIFERKYILVGSRIRLEAYFFCLFDQFWWSISRFEKNAILRKINFSARCFEFFDKPLSDGYSLTDQGYEPF